MTGEINPSIEESWKNVLSAEFNKPYFLELKAFLLEEKKKFRVFPPGGLIFNAFNHTPFDKVKVVFIGQDPYHGLGQAHGLCFSVPNGIPKPPSLINIFKELENDLGIKPPEPCLSFAPPAVMELGNATGFDFELQDRAGLGHEKLMQARNQFLKAAAGNPALVAVRANGQEDTPEFKIDLDLEKAGALEQSVPDHSIPARAGLASIGLELPRQGVVLVRLLER